MDDIEEKKDPIAELNLLREKMRRMTYDHSTGLYWTLFDQSPDPIIVIDPETLVPLHYNDMALKLLEYTREEFSALKLSDFEAGQSPEEIRENIRMIVEQGSGEFASRFRTKNGKIRDILVNVKVITITGKMYLQGIVRDITERSRMEDQLKLSNNLLRALADAQGQFIRGEDMRSLFGALLKNIIALTGSEYGFIGEVLSTAEGAPYLRTYAVTNIAWNDETRKYYEEYHEKGMEFYNLKTLFGAVLSTGEPVISNDPSTDPRRGGLPEGHPPMHAFLGLPIYHGKELCGMAGIANRKGGYHKGIVTYLHPFLTTCGTLIEAQRASVTGRITAEKLSQSEKQYRDLAESMNSVMLTWDREGNVTYFNAYAESFFGFSREEIIGRNVVGTIVPETETSGRDLATLMKEICLDPERFRDNENENITKDGRRVWVRWANKAIVDEAGRLSGVLSVGYDITERKHAEEALRRSETSLRKAQQIAKFGYWDWNVLTNELAWSDEVYRLYGVDPLRERPSYDIVLKTLAPECRDRFVSAVEDALKHGSHFEGEYRMISLTGEVRFTHTIGEVILDDGGRPVRMFGIVKDITERKLFEEALEAASYRLEYLMTSSPSVIYSCRFGGSWDALFASGNMKDVLGYDAREFVETPGFWAERIHPEDRQRVFDGLGSFDSCDVHVHEYRFRHRDGTYRWMLDKLRLMRNEQGEPTECVGSLMDITDRKLLEEKSAQTETRMRMAMSSARQGFFEIDVRTDDFSFSPDYICMMGYEPNDFSSRFGKWHDTIHPDDRETVIGTFMDYVSGRRDDCRSEFRQMTRSGEWKWIYAVATVVDWDDRGIPSRLFGIFTDITERKLAQEKVAEKDQFVRDILDTVDEGFIVVNSDFRILTANQAYCDQVGENCDSIIGKHCYMVSHRTLRPCYEEGEECAVRYAFQTGESHTVVHKHTDSKGGMLYAETKAFPLRDRAGTVISVIEIINNITERHLLEEERLKNQKLEAIGTLAGGIAHDFNNLLQGVFGYISLAKMSLDQKERSLGMLEQAEKALHMSVNLTTQLLTFSKGGKPLKKRISLRPVIENSARFALSGSSTEYSMQLAEDLWSADADEGQIGQVIQNIVLNADQAMPMGGTVVISAKNLHAFGKDRPKAVNEGDYVEISIRDSGIGIPENYLPRLFDPYFTTKEKGSGLGLATSYSIVKNHGGAIWVESELGRGSTFTFYLPAVGPEVAARETAAVPSVTRRGNILVMDDEELIRDIAGDMIKALGHDASFAENGESAIAKYREAMASGHPYDLVILDLTIRGGIGGGEALQKLLAIDPGVKAVVSSGYAESEIVSEYARHGFCACLTKPYHIRDLRDILHTLLGS